MGAHLREIRVPMCGWSGICGKKATKTLYNTRNAEIDHYCSKHAAQALEAFKKVEGEV